MADAGVHLIADQSHTGKVGLYGLGTIAKHWQLGQQILADCKQFKPDAILLVDYGGFHLQLAKRLKQAGFRVLYYIPPQVWASRPGRIKTIKQYVDHVFCIFPFEQRLYESHGIPVTYVGHPLAHQLPQPANRTEFCDRHHLDPNRPIVGLFPGSRKMEIEQLLEPILESLSLIQQGVRAQGLPEPQFCFAQAPSLSPDWLNAQWLQHESKLNGITVHQIIDENHALLSVADAAILASGTVTLEAALYDTPMVVVYKGPWYVYPIFQWLCQLPNIALPNVLADDILQPTGRQVVPELLQHQATPESIAQKLLPLVDSTNSEAQHQRREFDKIQQYLVGESNSSHAVAQTLLSLGE